MLDLVMLDIEDDIGEEMSNRKQKKNLIFKLIFIHKHK